MAPPSRVLVLLPLLVAVVAGAPLRRQLHLRHLGEGGR